MTDSSKTESPFEGIDRAHVGIREVEAGLKDSAKASYSRYRAYAEKAGTAVTAASKRGTSAIDRRLGDKPWALIGMDKRRTRVARRVVTELVPETLGNRATSFIDGVALKAGIGSAGLLLRLPLKPVAIPIQGVLGVIEAVKVVRDVRAGVGGIAAEIDTELAGAASER